MTFIPTRDPQFFLRFASPDDAGEVVRKDVYPNGREMHGAFVRAGIDR